MPRRTNILLAVAATLSVGPSAMASSGGSASLEASAASLSRLLNPIRSVARQQENTGFTFVMFHHGHPVLADFGGTAEIENSIAMQRDARFPIMSITKAFTGAALAHAVHEGLVDLDTPIAAYLPNYRGANAARITLRMLAAHTSGIPHTGHPQRKALYVEHFADARDAASVIEKLEPLAEPGAEYHYSSSGYNLIAAVIEQKSGMPFADYVRQRIIAPLKLQDTDFDDALAPQERRVRNYSWIDIWSYQPAVTLQEVPIWDFSYNMGGGNMLSTADDLARFGQAVLDGEAVPNDVAPLLRDPVSHGASSRWTLGWIAGTDEAGRKLLYITGATPGVQAALYVYPDDDLVFAMLANCWGKGSASGELVTSAPQNVADAYLRRRP